MDTESRSSSPKGKKKVYKIVLTGGPCGGKTTGQMRLSTFFENLGWKVYRVPETASVLLGGGVKFSDLDEETVFKFQENLLRTMLQMENTFFDLGKQCPTDCLIICDRGAMDVSAYLSKENWEKMLAINKWNVVELRDNRYNQVIHMVSAANGAEEFYTTEDHVCRLETVEQARILDRKNAAAWLGHPYYDVIDNSSGFDAKICRLISSICQKVGIDTGDRFAHNSKKRKWLVGQPLPPNSVFPPYQDFDVVHNYLQIKSPNMQARLRKRGQKGYKICNLGQFTYTHTIRRPKIHGQVVEVKTMLSHRDYINMLAQRDDSHFTIYKKRRCFVHNNQYFQLDLYCEPFHPRCSGLILLETYTSLNDEDLLPKLPEFLNIEKEVTGDPKYSMFNLSLREEWTKSEKFCEQFQGSGIEAMINNDLKVDELKQPHNIEAINGNGNGNGKQMVASGENAQLTKIGENERSMKISDSVPVAKRNGQLRNDK